MRRILVLVVAVAAGAVSAAAVSAGNAGGGGIVKVPLPAVQQSSGATFTFDVTAPAGKTVGPLRVQTVNDAKLGNLAVVYAVRTPAKASGHESVRVTVLIKRFLSRRLAARQGDAEVSLRLVPVGDKSFGGKITYTKQTRLKCSDIEFFDTAFETGRVKVSDNGGFWELSSGRDANAQPSPPEEVLDNIVAGMTLPAGCAYKPEGDDPGNK